MNIVCGRATELPATLYDTLTRYRYEVFVSRMGWDLKTVDSREQDQFDRDDTVHVVACEDDGTIVGCGRLLPTTTHYMLASVFPQLLNGLPAPSSNTIWELSRFAASEAKTRAGSCVGAYRAERVLLAAFRYCSARNVTHLLAVSTLPVERLMHRAGVDVHRIGPPALIGGQLILAFVIAVSGTSITALEAFESAAPDRTVKPVARVHKIRASAVPLAGSGSLRAIAKPNHCMVLASA